MYKNTEVLRSITERRNSPRYCEKSETLGLVQMKFKTLRHCERSDALKPSTDRIQNT